MKTIEHKPKSKSSVLLIKEFLSFLCSHEESITFIRAESNYSKVYFIDKPFMTICHTLQECEDILDKNVFFRCHRSYLVNSSYITGIDIKFINKLFLKNNVQIPISIRMKYELIRAIKFPGQSYLNKQLLKTLAEKLTLTKF